ncbi:hypothetical protein ACWXWI_01930 [Pantoea ananatis]
MTTNSPNPVDGDVQALDYFGSLVNQARARAEKAMTKFPQPNYVLNKVAEESGEVIKAVIHYTEGRETWVNVEAELIDNLAMLIRLVKEGDQVIGFTPPIEVQRLNATVQIDVIERESMKNLKWLFDLSKTCHALGIPLRISDSQVEKIAEAFLELEQRLNATAQPVSDGCKVPEGWKLVPVEPSWEMISAAIKHHEGDAFLPVSLYKTMLKAAPEGK